MAPAEPNALPFQIKGQEPHFPEEIDGWKGYIEWEKYPEKKKEAEAILEQYDFPDVSSSSLADVASRPKGFGADVCNTIAPRISAATCTTQEPPLDR